MPLRTLPPVLGPVPWAALVSASGTLFGSSQRSESATAALVGRFPGFHPTLLGSGTGALAMALQHSAPPGGQTAQPPVVALPAWCCPDVGAAALAAGAQVALYDLDPTTLLPDLLSLRACLEAGARQVVLVHFFGRITDPSLSASLAAEYGANIIEDAAQGAGAAIGERRAGALADWGVLSFGRGKGCNAGGGGALLSKASGDVPTVAVSAHHSASERFAQFAVTVASSALAHPRLYWLPASVPGLGLGDTVFHAFTGERGPSPLTQALLPTVLAAVDAEAAQRREISAAWRSQLSHMPAGQARLLEPAAPHTTDGALRFPVLLEPAVGASLRDSGVVRSYPRLLNAYPGLVPSLHRRAPQEWPGAALLAARLHTLPTHRYVTASDCERVARVLTRG